ncbi:hypothetical protein WDW86_14985 [Bdellovibrionota bacterium FG-2]
MKNSTVFFGIGVAGVALSLIMTIVTVVREKSAAPPPPAAAISIPAPAFGTPPASK